MADSAFSSDVSRHFVQLTGAGLDANSAAAYALKWAAGTAQPQDLSALPTAPASTTADGNSVSKLSAPMPEALEAQMQGLFSSADALYMSLILHCRHAEVQPCTHRQAEAKPHVHLDQLTQLYAGSFPAPEASALSGAVTDSIRCLVGERLPQNLTWCPAAAQATVLAALLLLPHFAEVSNQETLVAPYMALFADHQAVCGSTMRALFAAAAAPTRSAAVFAAQQFITLRLYTQRSIDPAIAAAAQLLELLNQANQAAARPIMHEEFYNDVVNSAEFDLSEDWRRYKAGEDSHGRIFSFCLYPFLYGASAKAHFLKLDARSTMREGMLQSLLQLSGSPFLVLSVRRGPELVRDALTRIRGAMSSGGGSALRKPLKVQFAGEPGVDEGGISREFFQLIVKECFSPNYGMFEEVVGRRVFWPRPTALSDLSDEFELIGVVVGLAIYNAHTLTINFPHAVYRKLLGRAVRLADLQDVHPEVHSSLQQLLHYPADKVEADMGLVFQVTHEVDFCNQQVELCPDGANVPVTGHNRDQFVEAYVRFLLEGRIEAQFDAFQRGFERVCNSPVLQLFLPSELEQVVCGVQELDLRELKRGAHYDGGYDSDSTVVAWFWEVLLGMEDDKQRQFLQFVTGSERVPVSGLDSLQPPFLVAKNGGQSDRLPTSHTCFNTLLLPEYETKDWLENRLSLALQNSTGFGLM